MSVSMEQLWELLQAQEAARVSVQSLAESARQSRVNKQRCQDVAQAGVDAFRQLEAALRQRALDHVILLTVAARLCETARRARQCVDEVGNPGAIGRITASFQRRSSERTLLEYREAFLTVGSALASPSLRAAASHNNLLAQHMQAAARSAHHTMSLGGVLSASARTSRRPSARGLFSYSSNPPLTGLPLATVPLAPQLSVPIESVPSNELAPSSSAGLGGLARIGTASLAGAVGPSFPTLHYPSGELVLSPSSSVLTRVGAGAGGGGSGREMPFGEGPVRPADGSRIHRLCFMRGVGASAAAVQLMVVLSNKAEVYTAALDSFHSDTPLDQDVQKVTAAALYEPTTDLITGHFGGTVLLYGRPTPGPAAAATASGTMHGGNMSAAAAAASAAAQAGVPLILRLSRLPVTALHCVPAVELEAATFMAAAATAGEGGEVANRAELLLTTTYTIDDVLLFTGDAVGRIMAVRYHRVQPEVLFCTVFQPPPSVRVEAPRERERDRDKDKDRERERERQREAERQGSTELCPDAVSCLLYRSGCLVVATSGGLLRTIRVAGAGQPGRELPSGKASGLESTGGANGRGFGAPSTGPSTPTNKGVMPGSASNSPTAAAAHAGGRGLPPSTSVNLLSPAVSSLPTAASVLVQRSGAAAAAAIAAAATHGANADGANGTGASANGAAHPFRPGVLHLNAALVDTYDFMVFGSCTSLVAVEWGPQPSAGSVATDGSLGRTDASEAAGRDDAAPVSGSYSRFWSSAGAAVGTASLGSWITSGIKVAEPNRAAVVAPRLGPWRLLSAHAGGQLLVWNVTAGRLNLVCSIGEPGPSIITIGIFPDLGTMVEVLSSGELRVGPPPSGSLAPPCNPLGGIPNWRLRQAKLHAHRSRITAATVLSHCVATGSRAGGVKVWSAVELRARAEEQGVSFMHSLHDAASSGVAAMAAAAAAAAAAAEGSTDGPGGSTFNMAPSAAAPPPRYPFPADVVTFSNLGSLPGSTGGAGPGGGGTGSHATASEERYPLGIGRAPPAFRPAPVATSPPPPPYSSQGGAVPQYPLQHLHPVQPAFPNHHHLDRPSGNSAQQGVASARPASPNGLAVAASPTAPRSPQPRPQPDSHYPLFNNAGAAAPLQPAASPVASSTGAGGAGSAAQMMTHAQTPFGAAEAAVLDSPADSVRGTPGKAHANPSATSAQASEHEGPVPSGTTDALSATSSNGGAVGSRDAQQRSPVHQQPVAGLDGGHAHGGHKQQAQQHTQQHAQQGQGQQPQAAAQQQLHHGHAHAPAANANTQSAPAKTEQPHGTASAAPEDDRANRPGTPFTTALEGELAQALAAAGNGGTGGVSASAKAAEEAKAGDGSAVLPVVLPAGLTAEEAEESAKADPRTRWGNAGFAVMQANRSKAVLKSMDLSEQEQPAPAPAPPPPPPVNVPHDVVQITPPYSAAMPDIFGHGAPAAVASPAFSRLSSMPRLDMAAPMGYGPSFGHISNPMFMHLGSMPRGDVGAMGYGPSFMQQQQQQQQHGYGDPLYQQSMHPMELLPPAVGPYGMQEYGMGPGPQGQLPAWGRSTTFAPGRGPYGGMPEPMAYPPRAPAGEYAPSQHVPGPPGRSMTRRVSNMSDVETMSHRTSISGHGDSVSTKDKEDAEMLPVPPVLPPPPRAPTAAPPAQPQQPHINPLLQHCFIRPEDVRLIDPVGQGAEGTVWRGRWHHIDVAVKEMHPTSASFGKLVSIAKDLSSPESARSSEVLAGVIKEVSALMDLGQHPNIIRFVGVCASPPPRIVTEYYKMGSLYSLLKEARQGNMRTREKLVWGKRLVMLQDIAAGMAYLHSRNYIHGDLRSPNVFVTEDQHLKIGDFGFARILGTVQNPNQGVPARLTNPRWQAPEVYSMNDPTATTAADVYSFGIIMYEMLTYQIPYDDVADDEMVLCRHTLNPHWRPVMPPDDKLPVPRNVHLQAYKALMMDCWAEDPAARPKFHKIAERLMALIRWQRTLSQVRRSLLGARQFKKASLRRDAATAGDAEAAVAVATATPEISAPPSPSGIAAAAVATGADPPALIADLGLTLAAHDPEHDLEIDRDLLHGAPRTAQPAATEAAEPATAAAATATTAATQAAAATPPAAAPASPSHDGKAAAVVGAVRSARDLLSQLPALKTQMALPEGNGPTTVAAVARAARAMATLADTQVVAHVSATSRLAVTSAARSGGSGSGDDASGSGSGASGAGGSGHGTGSGGSAAAGRGSGRLAEQGPPSVQTSISFGAQLTSAKTSASAGDSYGSIFPPAAGTSAPVSLNNASLPPLAPPVAPAADGPLEPVPTLASTGSRPLLLTAASTRGGAAAHKPAPGLGRQGDGFGLLSPFNALNLSDDEDAPPAPPPMQLGAPVRVKVPSSPPAAAPASAVARVAPVPPAPQPQPAAAASAAATKGKGDPFAMASPFNGIGSLDSDDEAPAAPPRAAVPAAAQAAASQAAAAHAAAVAARPGPAAAPAVAAAAPAVAAPRGADPFAMRSPFQGLDSLDDDD